MKLARSNSARTIHTARAITSQRPSKRGPLLFGVVATESWLVCAAERCCFKRPLPLKLPSVAHICEHHQVFGNSLTYDTIVVQETLQSSLRMTNLSDLLKTGGYIVYEIRSSKRKQGFRYNCYKCYICYIRMFRRASKQCKPQ